MNAESNIKLTKRTQPLVFAGRKKELESLHYGLSVVMEPSIRSRSGGGLTLVDGVPGVGKTQLLDEFSQQVTTKHTNVSVLELDVGDFTNDLNGVAAAILKPTKGIIGKLTGPLGSIEEFPFKPQLEIWVALT